MASAGTCGDSFAFPGRRYDWILTMQWPWAALVVSTKRYVHGYHQPRHKSLSPWWTLNQVLVSGWEPRAAANQQGQKGRPSSEHNYRCHENHRVGKCKQKLKNVLIRLPSGGWGSKVQATASVWRGELQVPRGGESHFSLQEWHWLYFSCSSADLLVCAHGKLFRTRDLIKKVSRMNHNVMISPNIFPVIWRPLWK